MFDVWLTCALSIRLSHAGALIRSELPAEAEKSATVSACHNIFVACLSMASCRQTEAKPVKKHCQPCSITCAV